MYEKGLLQITTPPCPSMDEEGLCGEQYEDGHTHWVSDARENDYDFHSYKPTAYLPHSCDNWVIGGPEQVKALIEDLTEMLKRMEV